jgi:predicted permease
MLAAFGSVVGSAFARWSAPLVVSMLRAPEDPVRLVFQAGWREVAFSFGLALLVTLLFGLATAMRVSAVQPVHALRGGEEPRSARRPMRVMLAAQAGFCVTVLFIAGLFLATFHRLSNRSLGFSPDGVLAVDVGAERGVPSEAWFQAAEELRNIPGVLSVAFSGWPLLSGNRWTGGVRLPGRAPESQGPYMLDISSQYFATMGIVLIDGRDLRQGDKQPELNAAGKPVAGVGVVNEAFARTYFDGQNPVGRTVNLLKSKEATAPMEIVGLVRDAVYYDMREPFRPTIYVMSHKPRQYGTLLVRTAADPQSFASTILQRIPRADPRLRVFQIQPQGNFVRSRLLRERLLATLSLFFAAVALVLAAIGVYGVLHYWVTRQRREIGIRMALGARPGHVVRRVTGDAASLVGLGSLAGIAAGIAGGRVVEALLYDIKPTGFDAVAVPILSLGVVALIASLPPALRAARVDPAETLRSE